MSFISICRFFHSISVYYLLPYCIPEYIIMIHPHPHRIATDFRIEGIVDVTIHISDRISESSWVSTKIMFTHS